MIVGKLLCENCGKDCTGGLWGFILATRGSLNGKQRDQLREFKDEFGDEQMIWCWNCTAKALRADNVKKQEIKEEPKKVKQPNTSGV